jgi:hypothetical protein
VRRAKRENGGLGEDPPGSPMTKGAGAGMPIFWDDEGILRSERSESGGLGG